MTAPAPHPDIHPVAFLLGTWVGAGRGTYPTIDDFTYTEEVSFSHVGKPFLTYTQRTKRNGDHPDAGAPLHAEAGYLRCGGDGDVELVVAQPSGIVEVDVGSVAGSSIRVRSTTVTTTPTAKDVDSVERWIDVEDDQLTYELWMGAVGEPHQFHLSAVLMRKVGPTV